MLSNQKFYFDLLLEKFTVRSLSLNPFSFELHMHMYVYIYIYIYISGYISMERFTENIKERNLIMKLVSVGAKNPVSSGNITYYF